MCGRLDYFLDAFAKLRIDTPGKSWTGLTCKRIPSEPLLLLSVLDFIESGLITSNFIEPSFELAQTFRSYCALLLLPGWQVSMSYPFCHLGSACFWELRPKVSDKHRRGLDISSVARLRQQYRGAKFSDDLYPLLQMPSSREKLRRLLIEKYFDAGIQQAISEHSKINCESAKYAISLLAAREPFPDFDFTISSSTDVDKIRALGFRKAIVKIYDHRCALCGTKILTTEGHTIVNAAHIKPWSISHDDGPTNGMALCEICLWSYDKGFMSVDHNYHVMISPAIKNDPNLPGHMLTLVERPMFRPFSSRYWPDQENLSWHRKERFSNR